MSLTALLPLVSSLFGTIGSVFVQRDQTNGEIKISAIGATVLCYIVSSIGCASSDQPYAQCMQTTVASLTTLFGG